MSTDDFRFDIAIVTDLKDGSQIKSSRRIVHTPTCAIFPEGMTQANIVQYVRSLNRLKGLAAIYRSDAFDYTARAFGQPVLIQVLEQLELELDELDSSAQIARIAPQLRRRELTAEHYFKVGRLVEGGQLEREKIGSWITVAVEQRLSPAELEESIIAGHVVKRERLPGGSEQTNRTAFISIQSLGTNFVRWQKQLENRGHPWTEFPVEQKRTLYDALKPIGEVWDRLKAEFEPPRNGSSVDKR